MKTVIDLFSQKASSALQNFLQIQNLPWAVQVQRTNKPEFGDFQIASCLQLGKYFKKSPLELAEVVAKAIDTLQEVCMVQAVAPGYVNITVTDECLQALVDTFRKNPLCDVILQKRQTMVIDFSSPNIAKPLHVGHIRTTILGDTIQRIFRLLGYHVIADNHLGDWGTQFGKLIVAYRKWVDTKAYEQDPIKELVRLYQLFESENNKELLHNKQQPLDEDNCPTELMNSARQELVKLQQKFPANYRLWEEFVSKSKKEFSKIYQRLDIRFDVELGESFYNDMLSPLVEDLLKREIAIFSQGAVICEIEGESTPLVIRKTDGSFLYGTTDIATILYRVNQWNPARIIYVVASAQNLHLRQVFAVAKKMGFETSLEHVSFGIIRFKDPQTGQFMTGSTRKGNVPWLDELLDEAEERAQRVVRDKNPDLSSQQVVSIAKSVGMGAIKYNILNRDYTLDINFDMETALGLEGNTAPYIQYVYARIHSILNKTNQPEQQIKTVITSPKERLLWWKIMDYPFVLHHITQTLKVHTLCDYLYQLATLFNAFYHEIPVLKANESEKEQRIQLLLTIGQIIREGLYLLGVDCLESM